MYQTKISVNDLVIDMPVDEFNVKQKMVSLSTSGLVQPVTVRLGDLRIIDGFHRTVAAQRLGWQEIDCIVQDCGDEAFWDARIQSAQQHAGIKEDRLVSWILECWRSTEWSQEAATNGQLEQQIIDIVWDIHRKAVDVRTGAYTNKKKLSPLELAIHDWLKDKSEKWGMHFVHLYQILFNARSANGFDEIAIAKNLTAKQRRNIGKQFVGMQIDDVDYVRGKTIPRLYAEDYVDYVLTTSDSPLKSLRTYIEEREQDEVRKATGAA